MKIKLDSGNLKEHKTELIVVPVFEGEKSNAYLNMLGKDFITEFNNLVKLEQFTGKFSVSRLISTLGKIEARNVMLFGLGKQEDFTEEQFRRAIANSHKSVRCLKVKDYHSLLPIVGPSSSERNVFVAAESSFLADYEFNHYKTEDKENHKKIETCIFWLSGKVNPSLSKVVEKAEIYAKSTCYARDLINHPPNLVDPSYLAHEARKLSSPNLKVTVFGKKELIKGKFNGILAVGNASAREPKLIIMDYNPKAKDSIAFVGKGITFDSGGLNIKPGSYMASMKCDMSGAAAVLGSIKAASQLKVKQRVIGVIASAENMPGGLAYRPDDIIKMYNGKTVEVGNTDAEGRIVLGDALAYTEKVLKPKKIIDLATLTGACVVALGYWATGMLTNDEQMAKDLEQAGINCGDRVWRLPLWDDYKDNMRSDVADVRNVGKGRDSGAIEAAIFLNHFVEKTPWVHLDIAGTAYLKDGKYYNPKDGTGAGVRLLLNYLDV